MTPQVIAERVAEVFGADDQATKMLGIRTQSIGPGKAVMTMQVTKDHVNGHGTCHGGLLFTFAGCALALACNSYNKKAVAQHCSITYISPAHIGDTLTASAKETSLGKRSGIYDVSITNELGEQIAEFRGHSRLIGGEHFVEPKPAQQLPS
ncbi:hydroxyphenylacetyl-CoA thioesterase PaaI [Flexibacterium corallicola]|uniref:hydroxyphenylacetyl-CoA thioesterase PaaI n=1 Tax=Flexibacterium corallicola TaxID=3037259 RepID=UPI00286FACF2|nr:hydroxyphenylacetyl-CoA thioesterase PaaI [Pseudovibrio sp. M1P-2-3]